MTSKTQEQLTKIVNDAVKAAGWEGDAWTNARCAAEAGDAWFVEAMNAARCLGMAV